MKLSYCKNKELGYPTCINIIENDPLPIQQQQKINTSVFKISNTLYYLKLTWQLSASEARLAAVEECDCQRSCRVNGTIRQDGATWKSGCEICSCVVSTFECVPCAVPVVVRAWSVRVEAQLVHIKHEPDFTAVFVFCVFFWCAENFSSQKVAFILFTMLFLDELYSVHIHAYKQGIDRLYNHVSPCWTCVDIIFLLRRIDNSSV